MKSGVHVTLAGVVLAMFIPLRVREKSLSWTAYKSPLHHLEHAMHPWVAFGVLPIFAFANAGVSILELSIADLIHPAPLGIATGLFLGKQVGIMAMSWLAVRMGIASLACEQDGARYLGLERLGVLTASLLAGMSGYVVLRIVLGDRQRAI